MGKKYQCLDKIAKRKMNTHSFFLIDTLEELKKYALENSRFSIRFDRNTDYQQLPFYTYDDSLFPTEYEKTSFLEKIVEEAKSIHCQLLCSNGYQYDDDLICNFVIKITSQQDFLLEWSTRKIPLREMYQFPTSSLKGNIKEDFKTMEWNQKKENPITESSLEKILLWAIDSNIQNQSIEGTLYSKKVGIKKEEIVCWQII